MKVLIIDNNTQHIAKIKRLLRDYDCMVVSAEDLGSVRAEEFDLIVLSGGRGRAVVRNRKYYILEREIISESNVPIIGICLGAQMIADVYGGRLERLGVRRRLYNKISFVDGSEYDLGHRINWVFQMHKWAIRKLPDMFRTHAVSGDGIELFEHASRPLYGMQFHPEVRYGSGHGAELFGKILLSIQKR
jgi:GMP synthase-like glutamine amidotransferase